MEGLGYYLETNAVYDIRKIPDSILDNSFYSALSILELVAGINQENYSKRKTLLSRLLKSESTYYGYFPDDIIWASFDYFITTGILEKRYVDSRVKAENLINIAGEIVYANDYDEFIAFSGTRAKHYPFDYFKLLDTHLSEHFYEASANGNYEVAEALKASGNKEILMDIGGVKYDVGSRKGIKTLLENPLINNSFTIIAHATDAMRTLCGKATSKIEEQVYNSYNGSIEIYINAFSKYTASKTLNGSTPSRNDLQDLLHIAYLRNRKNILMVTHDKLFKTFIPDNTISIEELGSK